VKRISIVNDVLGPIMRGPSSSHTAASYHIALKARELLGEAPAEAEITFHAGSSYAVCFRRQGSDLAFVAGLLGWPITDARFKDSLRLAPESGLTVRFDAAPLPKADHPNYVRLGLVGVRGARLEMAARSVGGGMFELAEVNGTPSSYRGPELLPRSGEPPFASSAEMVAFAEARGLGAGDAALAYESMLLGIEPEAVAAEVGRRLDVMSASVASGLAAEGEPMILLDRSAHRVFAAEARGVLPVGGLHTRAAARALAAMHTNCGMGVVCAAPTAGSAGVLPGVMATLQEDLGADRSVLVRCLLAAGLVGVFIAERATFAAEIAGCQVEIGAASAMAAAAVVEFGGGSAAQCADAAAVSLQNTMGSVCDLVQGVVEIPCHTRNAAGASSAFVVADLIMGGYANPIPLDETIDAVYAVGRMLPDELKVTSLGGIAVAPPARAMKPRR